jgi:phosphate transport system substrate-binding protein
MNKKSRYAWSAGLTLGLAIASNIHGQTPVKLHGAVTLEKLITAQKAAIETQAGVKLETVANGSGRGLSDLAAGLADIGMIGGSLKGVADATNKEKPGSVDVTGMKEMLITSVKLAIVSHPGVGVKSLTTAQIADIFSGKITNWKAVGGADLPVKVVLPFAGDGARITLQETALKNTDFVNGAIIRNSNKDIPQVVSQLPGACSVLTIKNVEGNIASIAMEKDILLPMCLVVKGEATGAIQKTIDAIKASVK